MRPFCSSSRDTIGALLFTLHGFTLHYWHNSIIAIVIMGLLLVRVVLCLQLLRTLLLTPLLHLLTECAGGVAAGRGPVSVDARPPSLLHPLSLHPLSATPCVSGLL